MPRLDRTSLAAVSPVPAVTGSEPPARRREFRHLRAAHISKALAGAVGVSRSYTSRQLRGEDPVPGETFRTWCARAARDGFLNIARAEIAEDAAVVGLGVYALPTETGPAIAEVGDLVEAASTLAACILRALADGELSVEEIDQALKRIDHTQNELDEARASLVEERRRLSELEEVRQ